jgi:hypothetical protein
VIEISQRFFQPPKESIEQFSSTSLLKVEASIFVRITGGSPSMPLTAESLASGLVSSVGCTTMVVLGFWVVLGTIAAMMMMNRGSSLRATGRTGEESSEPGKGFSKIRRHADADSDGAYAPG